MIKESNIFSVSDNTVNGVVDCTRIISFQHKDVLEKVIYNGEYKCSVISSFHKQAPILYELCSKLLEEKTGINANPVFGWQKVTTQEKTFVDSELLSEKCILTCNGMVACSMKDYVLLDLSVPSNFVALHDFFDFSSFKADEEEELCSREDLEKFVYNSPLSDRRDVQAIFPMIKKEWLLHAYSLEWSYSEDLRAYNSINGVTKVKIV